MAEMAPKMAGHHQRDAADSPAGPATNAVMSAAGRCFASTDPGWARATLG